MQYAIALPYRRALGRADFLVSRSNAAALSWIERWPDWPDRVLLLHGPTGSGKTHLVHLWRQRADADVFDGAALPVFDELLTEIVGLPALAIDDCDRAAEPALFHLYNAARERGAGLLLAMRQPPAAASIALPDLASRLRAAPAVGIDPPDDALLGGVLLKQLGDRGMGATPEAVAFLLRRIERSFAAVAALAEMLDRATLIRRRREVTLPVARDVLARL